MKVFCILVIAIATNLSLSSANTNQIADAFVSLVNKLSAESSYEDIENGIINKANQPFSVKINNYRQIVHRDIDVTEAENGSPRVLSSSGLLIGETNSNAHTFYSVPYAAPPTGPRRYMPPEAVENMDEKNVSVPDYRNCWQILNCEPNCTEADGNLTEDCLVVTIDVPKVVDLSDPNDPPMDRLPVMFWIHGGFFLFGSGTTYKLDARKLSQDANVVVVRVNYRLGPLGFLSFQDGKTFIEGNQGLKDQQFALQWVQDNIEKFGGDKNKVTLFGNSAGSQSIMFHLLSSHSDPLFQRGIIQSSPTVFSYQTPKDSSQTITKRYLEALECIENPVCLRNLDPSSLMEASRRVMGLSLRDGDFFGGIEPFRPVIDGIEFIAQPLTMFKNGWWQTHKEVIIGTTEEEMAYIDSILTNIPFPKALFQLVNNAILGDHYGDIITEYYDNERVDFYYGDNLAEEVTDMFFVCPNRAFARFASATSTHPQRSVYLYNLAYPLSTEFCEKMQSFPPVCGTSHHTSEIVLLMKADFVYGANFSTEDNLVSDMFTSYWGEFARAGNPSSAEDKSEFTTWPTYINDAVDPWKNIALQYDQSFIEANYKKEICDLWDETGFYFENTEISSTATEQPTTPFTAQPQPTTEDLSPFTTQPQPTTKDLGEIDTTTSGATSVSWHSAILSICLVFSGLWATCFTNFT